MESEWGREKTWRRGNGGRGGMGECGSWGNDIYCILSPLFYMGFITFISLFIEKLYINSIGLSARFFSLDLCYGAGAGPKKLIAEQERSFHRSKGK